MYTTLPHLKLVGDPIGRSSWLKMAFSFSKWWEITTDSTLYWSGFLAWLKRCLYKKYRRKRPNVDYMICVLTRCTSWMTSEKFMREMHEVLRLIKYHLWRLVTMSKCPNISKKCLILHKFYLYFFFSNKNNTWEAKYNRR